jgi:nuclear protein localization family protein 4
MSSRSHTVSEQQLKHGDILYMKSIAEPSPSTSKATSGPSTSSSGKTSLAQLRNSSSANLLNEDDVDLELYKMDGLIKRNKDDK